MPGSAVGNDVIWGILEDYSFVVIHNDVTADTNASVFFTSDRIAVRGTLAR